jgi:lipoate-protein ligase A
MALARPVKMQAGGDRWTSAYNRPMPEPYEGQWRIIISAPASGPANMALDEAILQAVSAGQAPPTLRLYGWSPACLSLGYAQPAADADLDALRNRGWDIVRRPTGGRAILHVDELTYSAIGPAIDRYFAGSVLESYQHLSQALVTSLGLLGLAVRQGGPNASAAESRQNPVCFENPSAYEILVGERKLIGSAQLRRRGGVLQHGSLPLCGDITRICQVLAFEDDAARDEAAARLSRRALTLESALGRRVEWPEAARALRQGFGHAFGVSLTEEQPTPPEIAAAKSLEAQIYRNETWTARL